MEAGDRIRCKRFAFGVRVGGAEPKTATCLSAAWAVYKVWSAEGRYICEIAMPRAEFDRDFEKVPDGD